MEVWFGDPNWGKFFRIIFVLKPWAHAGHYEYHEAYKRNKTFLSYKEANPLR